jgi:hypothetical protein
MYANRFTSFAESSPEPAFDRMFAQSGSVTLVEEKVLWRLRITNTEPTGTGLPPKAVIGFGVTVKLPLVSLAVTKKSDNGIRCVLSCVAVIGKASNDTTRLTQ